MSRRCPPQQFVQRLVGRHGCKDLLLLQLGGTRGCRQLWLLLHSLVKRLRVAEERRAEQSRFFHPWLVVSFPVDGTLSSKWSSCSFIVLRTQRGELRMELLLIHVGKVFDRISLTISLACGSCLLCHIRGSY
jgi:hypothetical protein